MFTQPKLVGDGLFMFFFVYAICKKCSSFRAVIQSFLKVNNLTIWNIHSTPSRIRTPISGVGDHGLTVRRKAQVLSFQLSNLFQASRFRRRVPQTLFCTFLTKSIYSALLFFIKLKVDLDKFLCLFIILEYEIPL